MDSLERLRPERELVIVYAGPRGAGKSTNLKALARRQGQTFERSLCLERGALRGVALRWRVEIAAEGAAGERALAEADGVVYVCRSRADELAGLRALLATYAERPALERPPIVVQANMQDVAGALGPRAVLEAAGAPLLVIPAIASEGRGVESTLRVLIHECTERLRARFATPATGVPAAARRPRTSTPALGVPAVPTTAERAPAVKVFQEEDTSAAKVS
ncbi:MAG: hypothetical protein KC636_18605 [Myxococcales bacterium]|nr:hypothetical protein [Myxococcales bacterium]